MVKKPPRLKLTFTPRALRDLDRIWDYNCDVYGADHADRYITFRKAETAKLKSNYMDGNPVPIRPELRYHSIKRRYGHGHVVIYQVLHDSVEVLYYFHTAQDWQTRLLRD